MSGVYRPKRQRYTLEQSPQDEVEEHVAAAPSSHENSAAVGLSAPGTPSESQNPEQTTTTSSVLITVDEESTQEEGNSSSGDEPNSESLFTPSIEGKVAEMMEFLLTKYQTKEPTVKIDMHRIVEGYEACFPIIFQRACECIELVFGLTVKEDDHLDNGYVFCSTLGLTCEGILKNDHGVPKGGLLMVVLSTIFREGNCATEERVWKVLSRIGVYPGIEHAIYGEPRKFLTQELVQAKYLEYRRVPNCHPALYEFLWGPRAHEETSKMKFIEFWAQVNDTIPSAFPDYYEEALKEERAKAMASSSASP
ncbi:melanoma-associated antigen 10 [Echinops telfairi]|uniref:Melanoma-associated antigen 10 n=1 Tax=Echinops telfairi TaxID=9371 RepID=A0ABM0J2L4_ECHTE|nr:melanoma-associated antigen 10 [Echinops telfairi]